MRNVGYVDWLSWFDAPEYEFARQVLQRGVAALYFVAFLSSLNQFPALLGERGLLPAPEYLGGFSRLRRPTLFRWRYSDRLLRWVCVAGLGMLLFDGWLGPQGMPWQFVLGVGMSCAVTALPILILLMEKLNILRQPIGQRILRYASLDDIAIWGVLALILLDWDRVGRQGMFLVGFAAASYLYRKLMVAIPERDRWYVSLVWLAIGGFAGDWSGLHFMVGAFLAGAVTDSHWFNQEEMDKLRHHVLLVIMPVFFLSTGLRTNWDVGGTMVFIAAAVLLVASVSGKLAGVHLAGRILKWERGEASIIGWLLQTKALIMIIFANVLLDKQIITSETFTALLLMAVASTMLTVPVVAPKLERLREVIFRSK